MSGNFRYTRWDPVLISAQIVAIQSTFYVTLGLCFFVFSHLFGHSLALDLIFNFQVVSFRTTIGLLVTFTFILNAFIGALILFYIVQRAKPCLDFTLTTFIIHFVFVWLYNGLFPSSFAWWILIICCLACMCVFGEFLCLKSEMKAIPLLVSHSSSL